VTNPSRIDYEDVKNKRINHRRAPGAGASVAPSRSETLDPAMSSTIIVLKTLAEHIAARLEERAFCVVFENDLEHCWPRKELADKTGERNPRLRRISGLDCRNSRGWVRYEGNISKAVLNGLPMFPLCQTLSQASKRIRAQIYVFKGAIIGPNFS